MKFPPRSAYRDRCRDDNRVEGNARVERAFSSIGEKKKKEKKKEKKKRKGKKTKRVAKSVGDRIV